MTDVELDAFDETATQARSRDRWFNPWLCAKGDGLKSLVESFVVGLQTHEKHTDARKRARRPNDIETLRRVVEVVVANLALACLDPPETGRIAISFRKGNGRSRYDDPALSTLVIKDALTKWQEYEAVSMHIGSRQQRLSTIAPTQWFANRVADYKVSIDDFGTSEEEEIIILKRKNTSPEQGWSINNRADWEDYEDTGNSTALRAELRALNKFLKGADLGFAADGKHPSVNTRERTLRRYFTVFPKQPVTFDQNGRLFGGWWLNLKSGRRANLRIEGESPVIVDYASMFGRLAFAHVGVQPPEGDLYDLTGLLDGYSRDVKDHRSGVKKVFNAMLFGGGMGKRLPSGAREYLPAKVTVDQVRRAITDRNPELAALFGSNVGYRLMFVESQILMTVLGLLMARNIVALPLHDGLMVGVSKGEEAAKAMIEGAKSVTGFRFPVDLKEVNSFNDALSL
jgi:hypothetical protein